MKELGPPVAYRALPDGVPVYGSDGVQVGDVEHVLADDEKDIFDGLVINVDDDHRFVDARLIAELHERGVLLAVDHGATSELPQPSENPAVLRADPADTDESDARRKLRRAWDLISGNY